jgi:hypothetical protein
VYVGKGDIRRYRGDIGGIIRGIIRGIIGGYRVSGFIINHPMVPWM